ncbi:MAG: serine--tRNA ligase, partial [Coriobacteriales bacterium]
MLDARFVRENVDAVRTALANRRATWDVDRFVALDEERRALIGQVESLQARRNELSKQIGGLMKSGDREGAERRKDDVRVINEEIASLEGRMDAVDTEVREMLLRIPNIPDDSVPVGADETANVEIRRWGTPPAFDFEPKPHWDLGP